MMRAWYTCLLCTLVGLALTLSGASAGAARLSMAIQMATSFEVVLCGDAGAEVVRLDAQGKAMTPGTGDCARCPDCMVGSGFAPPAPAKVVPLAVVARQAAPVTPQIPVLIRATGPVRARAPPKGT